MGVSTIYSNHGTVVVQAHDAAVGARVTDGGGRYLDIHYDPTTGQFVIEAESCNIRVTSGSNKIWVEKR